MLNCVQIQNYCYCKNQSPLNHPRRNNDIDVILPVQYRDRIDPMGIDYISPKYETQNNGELLNLFWMCITSTGTW